MNIKKPLLIAGVAATLGVAGIGGIASASANSGKSDDLIDKIATRFNLNKDEVAQVFEEDRTARETERQQRVEERLTQAVKDGKLTEAQKQKILTKQAELKAKMDTVRQEMEGKTEEEQRTYKEQHAQDFEDLKKWATDNGIPIEYLHFVGGMGHGPGGPGPDKLDIKELDKEVKAND